MASATTFKPDQPAILAWHRYAGAQSGAALTGRLVFLAPGEEIEAMTTTARLEKADDTAHFRFASPADGWPEGRYRLAERRISKASGFGGAGWWLG